MQALTNRTNFAQAHKARRARLASAYDAADRHAIGSTDDRTLFTFTLTHWLYVRATAGQPYSWVKMLCDYSYSLDGAGLRHSDVRRMPANSRPQIARRALIRAYAAYRAERERRRVDLFDYGALGIAAE